MNRRRKNIAVKKEIVNRRRRRFEEREGRSRNYLTAGFLREPIRIKYTGSEKKGVSITITHLHRFRL